MKTMGLVLVTLLLAACQNPAGSNSGGPPYTVTYRNTTVNTTGTVPVDNTVYQPGDTVTVKGNTGNLSWPGFTLIGWNTQDNGGIDGGGGGSQYPLTGGSFTINSNVTLYGTWQ